MIKKFWFSQGITQTTMMQTLKEPKTMCLPGWWGGGGGHKTVGILDKINLKENEDIPDNASLAVFFKI